MDRPAVRMRVQGAAGRDGAKVCRGFVWFFIFISAFIFIVSNSKCLELVF